MNMDAYGSPPYLKVGQIRGRADLSFWGFTRCLRFFLLAGGCLVKVPWEHWPLSLRVTPISVKFRQTTGEVLKGSAMVIANHCEVHLCL